MRRDLQWYSSFESAASDGRVATAYAEPAFATDKHVFASTFVAWWREFPGYVENHDGGDE